MSKEAYSPSITVRWRPIDAWFGAECPDCGASVIDKTVNKVKNGMQAHGKKNHIWKNIRFREQI
jgi:hypothetical protein